jgi:hypothetical protein
MIGAEMIGAGMIGGGMIGGGFGERADAICPLSGVKRTPALQHRESAFDPKMG